MRHIIALSGGKDSSALAIYMQPRLQTVEYVFCDTGRELPGIYEFLDRLECVLKQEIVRLKAYPLRRTKREAPPGLPPFDHWLEIFGYYLPSPRTRWCTQHLKIRPFERYIGKDDASVYIAIRADEDRSGNYGNRPNITYRYPFVEDGIDLQGVKKILEGADIKLPDFYKWRSTGGCWCCPFQRRSDWHGLKRNHPDLFQHAKNDEKKSGKFNWSDRFSLEEIESQLEFPIFDALENNRDDWEDQMPCTICAK